MSATFTYAAIAATLQTNTAASLETCIWELNIEYKHIDAYGNSTLNTSMLIYMKTCMREHNMYICNIATSATL